MIVPYARSTTGSGTLIHYTSVEPLAHTLPPWTLSSSMPEVQSLICRPSSSYVIEDGRIWRDYPSPPSGPQQWMPAP